MSHLHVLALLLLAAPAPDNVTPANEKLPDRAPPNFVAVADLDREKGIVTYQIVVAVPVVRKYVVVKDGKEFEVTSQEYRSEMRMGQLEVKGTQVMEAGGKKISEEAAWARLRKGTILLLSADGKEIHPNYLLLLKSDTLIFIEPWRQGKPIAPSKPSALPREQP